MLDINETMYLIACHLIISDKEINSKEVETLDEFLNFKKTNQLLEEQHNIFSDSDKKIAFSTLLLSLSSFNYNEERKRNFLQLLCRIAFSDGFVSVGEKKILNLSSG